MSRLTRKEIKRDEVLDWAARTVAYVREHNRGLVALLLALVVAATSVAAVFAYRGRQVERANQLLADALAIHSAPIDELAPDPDNPLSPSFASQETRDARAREAFEALRDEFGGERLGAVAASYLGDLAARSGDLERAESLWQEALGTVDDSLLAGRLQMSLINLERSRGGAEAVVTEVRRLMSSGEGALPDDVLLYELGQALENLGRSDEARSAFERLLEEQEASVLAPEARRRLASL